MFERLGKFIERRWPFVLVFWAIALLAAIGVHPMKWYSSKCPDLMHEVAQDGEFSFLPPNMQSLLGEQLLANAFPEDLLKSSVVIVVRRYHQPIRPEDMEFIEQVLKPRLEKIRDEQNLGSELQIMTPNDPRIGRLLVSDDKEACLVIMPLKSEFLEWGNLRVIGWVEWLLYDDLPSDKVEGNSLIPPGLDLAMSGSATVGRDMLVAERRERRLRPNAGRRSSWWCF